MFWIGLAIGMFIGANVGFLAMALCRSASVGDKQIRDALAKVGRR